MLSILFPCLFFSFSRAPHEFSHPSSLEKQLLIWRSRNLRAARLQPCPIFCGKKAARPCLNLIPHCFPPFFNLQKVDVPQARIPDQTRQLSEELLLHFNKKLNHFRLLILVHQQALLRRIVSYLLQTLARQGRSRQVCCFTYLRICQERA